MAAILTDTQMELVRVALSMSTGGVKRQRAALEGETLPPEPTATLMRDFAGLAVPESSGGAGGELIDLLVFVESLAQTVEPTPFFVHTAALQTAVGAGLDVRKVLESGDLLTIGALERAGQRWGEWAMPVSESTVEGNKIGVPFAREGGSIVVVGANDGVALATIQGATPRTGFDPSMHLADVRLAGKPVSVATGGSCALARGALVLAASALGTARGSLRMAADYATARQQFGQPIGSFQGIAHMLSDCFVDVEAAWSLLLFAGWSFDVGDPGAMAAAHGAIAKAGSTAVHVTERALQVHGGIGVTWEADPHLYLRRVMTLNALVGAPVNHFRALGARLVAGSKV
ncbi:MAG: acyl-CoA dehydrogenase family protein [Ilumatobacteraceae bacterium]|jgi:alkylation response protein AidB-like acyl-CoA dehydrogenase